MATLATWPNCQLFGIVGRSEEHTSELQSRVDISYAVFCLKKNCSSVSVRSRISPQVVICFSVVCSSAGVAVLAVLALLSFFNYTATTEIYTLSLHDALPISDRVTHLERHRPAGGDRTPEIARGGPV